MPSILARKESRLELDKLREALDLVQLVLAVQPTAIRPILEKMQQRYRAVEIPIYVEELDVIARGVPVQLRTRFTVDEESLGLLKDSSVLEGIKMLDEELSTDETFLAVRQELMARVESDTSKLLQLNERMVPVVVIASLKSSADPSEATALAFLNNLTALSAALDSYQLDRASWTTSTTIATRHVRFEVTHIQSELGRLVLSPQVVESAMKLMTTGLPVESSLIELDLRQVRCDEDQLRALFKAVTERSKGLFIETANIRRIPSMGLHATSHCIDENGEDYRERIRMILRTVGSVGDRVYSLDLGGWFQLCEQTHNRAAIWRGLFEDVLSADSPCTSLCLTKLSGLQDGDRKCIKQIASDRLRNHPEKKFRVKNLTLGLQRPPSMSALRALLSTFGDVEVIHLWYYPSVPLRGPPYQTRLSRNVVDALVSFPTLRKLMITMADVSTMDLFNPSINDDRQAFKPVLEELELRDIALKDRPSLLRFLTSLDPLKSTSPLTASLRKLRVTQANTSWNALFDSATVAALDEMLESNRVLSNVTVTDNDDISTRGQWEQLLRHAGRFLPAPPDHRKTALAKACNAAFISTILSNTGSTTARNRLDADIIRLIFDFDAPVVVREINAVRMRRFQAW